MLDTHWSVRPLLDRTHSKLCTKVLFLLKTSLPFTENATTFPKEFQNILVSESVSVLKTLDLSWEINKQATFYTSTREPLPRPWEQASGPTGLKKQKPFSEMRRN